MSVWVSAIEAARMAVKMPIAATTTIASWASPNSGFTRATRYTPALTIVAAWIRAETGVGPSIASGSQTWSGNWALLPIAPANTSRAMRTTMPWFVVLSSASFSSASWMFSVPVFVQIAMIPRANPTSPTRLTMNAFLAAIAALGRLYQNPMSE